MSLIYNNSSFRDQSGIESIREPTQTTKYEDENNIFDDFEGDNFDDNKNDQPTVIKQRNDLIGPPSDVALLRYVETTASVEGIRQRFHVNRNFDYDFTFKHIFRHYLKFHLILFVVGNLLLFDA